MFAEADVDGSGMITAEEFVAFAKKNQEQLPLFHDAFFRPAPQQPTPVGRGAAPEMKKSHLHAQPAGAADEAEPMLPKPKAKAS